MLTSGMQALAPADRFSSEETQTSRQTGSVIERRVMRTTIYDNPPSAPEPSVYVAFDFVGRFENADRQCGYIIVHQLAPGEPYRVTRTEQTYLPNDQAAHSSEPADELWARMATSFCPGWERSWAIQPPV